MSLLPPSPFLSDSVGHSAPAPTGSAVALIAPPAADATAAPNSALASAMTADTAAAPDLTDPPVAAAVLIDEPSMTMEVPSEASAPAPTKNPDADALGTDHIHEIFFYVRKLMKQTPRFVLDDEAFLADVEEAPLFLREDGYLQRREA